MDLAPQFGLSPQVIEKDYVLGWMLAGLSAHAALAPSWVFKGGTCLKKCYFETYQFSEDLDFTLLDAAHLNQDFLIATFEQIADWIYQQAGIEIPRDTIRFDFYDNPRGKVSVLGRVGYRGPMQRRGDAPRIRFDLTNDEILALEPSIREVNHPYSDKPELGIQVRCYSFEEVFAEKVRALAERTRPRDLYDVIHLYRHHDFRPDRAVVIQTLQKNVNSKELPYPLWQRLTCNQREQKLKQTGNRCWRINCPHCRLSINSGKNCLIFSTGCMVSLKNLCDLLCNWPL